jgi:hypothetical protein
MMTRAATLSIHGRKFFHTLCPIFICEGARKGRQTDDRHYCSAGVPAEGATWGSEKMGTECCA